MMDCALTVAKFLKNGPCPIPLTPPKAFPLRVVCLDIYRQEPHSESRAQRASFCPSVSEVDGQVALVPLCEAYDKSPHEGSGVAPQKIGCPLAPCYKELGSLKKHNEILLKAY